MSGRKDEGSNSSGNAEDTEEIRKCRDKIAWALRRDPRVKFMVEKITQLGCELPTGFFSCNHCEEAIIGGFHISEDLVPGVAICANNAPRQDIVNRTLTHELIHAYDRCRAKLLPDNCLHIACSEVRAGALSGDCDFTQELNRRNVGLMKQHQVCVKRRAELSLKGNPVCREKAKLFVDSVFEKCYSDTSPFERMP